ncbi:MAG: hypothetical protein ABIJ75_02450 [Actinomycetota bacterium]
MTIPTTLNVARPAAEGYGALLTYGADAGDDIYLQIATTQSGVQRDTSPQQNNRPNLASSPEDFRAEGGLIFSRGEFSGGEGLDRGHRAGGSELDPTRFWDSKHIRVAPSKPGVPETLRLGWEPGTVTGSTAATPHAVKVADGVRVFWADGTDVVWSNDILSDDVGDFTVEAPGAATTISGLALDGKTLYAAMNGTAGKGLYQRTWAGVWSKWSNLDANDVWVVKRRVLASDGAALYEAAAADGSTLLKTLDSNITWTQIIDAGHLILAAATDGKIYAFSDEAGTLILRGETELHPGEVPYTLAYAGPLLLIGVGDDAIAGGKIGRLYGAEISGVRIINIQLMREWGGETSTVNHTPQKMSVTRDEVLVPAIDTAGTQAVWAYILSTAGLYRRVATTGTGLIRHAIDFDGRVVCWRDAATILRESLTAYSSTVGYLITPYVDWYSAATKSIVGLRIESADIPAAGAQIDVYYSTNRDAILNPAHASWVLAKSLTYTGDKSVATEIPLIEVTGRGVAVMLKLTRSTAGTASPSVTSVSARAYEDSEGVVLTVPVNVSDVIERPGKTPIRVPGRGLATYTALRAREGSSGQLEILRTGEKVKGQVVRLSQSIPAVTPRGSSILVSELTVEGVNV